MTKTIQVPKGEFTTSAHSFSVSVTSSTLGRIAVPSARVVNDPAAMREIEKAVYSHIRAIRTLGRTSVTVTEIAAALGISVSDAERALMALESKGVKAGA